MIVQIRLHGALRDQVLEAVRGQLTLTLPESSSVQELLAQLNLVGDLQVAVNGDLAQEWTIRLSDGDRAEIFHSVAGG